jgi:dTMP kinase
MPAALTPYAGPGRFLAFEGADASGKSTQIRLLADRLRDAGVDVLVSREPGGTAVGARIRSLVLDHSDEGAVLSPRAEALLMAADRAQHVAEVIRPALEAGRTVLCDRYLGSSIAYQGVGRGLGAEPIERLSLWATEDLVPTLTIVIRVPVEVSLERLAAQGSPDRLESLGPAFVGRVSEGYEQLLSRPATVGVWGIGTPGEVAERVWSALVDAGVLP